MNFEDQLNKSTLKRTKSGKTRSEIAKSAIRKGKSGERKICNILKKASELNFERIPSSGARLGKSNRDKIEYISENQLDAFLGDIFGPLETDRRFIVESKNYKTLSWGQLDKGKIPAKLKGWIGEVCYDTVTYYMCKYSREPLSFLGFNITGKTNRGEGLWICYNEGHFLDAGIKDFDPKWSFDLPLDMRSLYDHEFNEKWHVEDLKSFVERNKKELFVLQTI